MRETQYTDRVSSKGDRLYLAAIEGSYPAGAANWAISGDSFDDAHAAIARHVAGNGTIGFSVKIQDVETGVTTVL